MADQLIVLQSTVTSCEKCPRLRRYCSEVAQTKRRAFLDWNYWGQPVPSFGDPQARLLVIGLAPAAHGGNRTGRMFTGDRSGDFLYEVLYRTGFASQPASTNREDGLTLRDCYVTAAVRCAPPGNKPSPEETKNCAPYLSQELGILRRVRAVVALGRFAFDAYLRQRPERGAKFGHGAMTIPADPGAPILLASYHPSQQNTFTGKLTMPMLVEIFEKARMNLTARRH
jgi:uracil-DNA glycosylase family 4